MRIGYLTYGLDRSPTGIGRYALELLRSLSGYPSSVEIIVLATEPRDVFGLRSTFEYHHVPRCRTLPALMTYGNLALRSLAERLQLDLIHDPNGIAPFLLIRKRTKAMVTLHDAFAFVYPEVHNAVDNWRYKWYLPVAMRSVDAVTTISECSRSDLMRHLGIPPGQISLAPPGVGSRFRPSSQISSQTATLARYGIQGPYLLYVGALNARKNVARMMHAFARIHSRHPRIQLVIAGKRQWKTAEIDDACGLLELQDAVRFTGYVDDEDLPALYSGATAFLFPTLYEGFGLPVLEAMACGTPVITSNSSSIPEVTGNAAILVNPFSVEEIAAAIDRVLLDEELRTELSRNGIERAKHFTWARAAELTVQRYEATVSGDAISDIPMAVSETGRGTHAN